MFGIFRNIILVFLAIVLTAFVAMNSTVVRVNWWPDANDYLGYRHSQGPFGLVALIFFLLGFVPMWLFARAAKWRAARRIASLENSLRAATPSTPVATSTQLEAATPLAPSETPNI
ncbi:MAG: lipopolysaccharide assembly protein LapA domain-containing protein [Novosphingobium sp.]